MPQDAPPNGSAPDQGQGPWSRVAGMQAKLHRWAAADPGRRFDDLFNFVHDPATLYVAYCRVEGNRGANTPGVDGMTVRLVEERIGVQGFLDDLRAALKDGSFRPLPVRERMIPKPGGSGKLRRLGIPAIADRVRAGADFTHPDVIAACARTKLRIVGRDERDSGLRHVLNLGHTVGHAIETVTGYYYQDGGVLGAALLSYGDPGHVVHAFPWVQCGSLTGTGDDLRFYGFNHNVRLYIDGPASLQFDADGGSGFGGSGNPSGGYSVSGFLEGLPPN